MYAAVYRYTCVFKHVFSTHTSQSTPHNPHHTNHQQGLYAAREGQPLALSNSLSALTRLTCMWVADGRLDNLHALSKLSALRSLWLHTCALQGVPPALAQTTTLERLIVLNDDVQVLPEWLAQLPYLSSISIIDNASAVAVSSSITRMTALTSLRCVWVWMRG